MDNDPTLIDLNMIREGSIEVTCHDFNATLAKHRYYGYSKLFILI